MCDLAQSGPAAELLSEPKPESVVGDFIRKIETSFGAKDVQAIEALFLDDGYLRE